MSISNWAAYHGRRRHRVTPRWRARRDNDRVRALESGPTLEMIVAVPRLMACFEDLRRSGGQAPGPDRLRYSDFGRQELAAALTAVREAVLSRTYCVPPPRTVKRQKKDGSFRELTLDGVVHRTLAASATDLLRPVLTPHIGPTCHSAGGGGVHSLLAALYWAAETGRYGALVNHDVRKAFPSLPVNVAMASIKKYVADPGVLWLVELLLRGASEQSNHVGIPQGLALSPLALDISMSVYLDRYWPRYPDSLLAATRYVDNIVLLAASMHDGRQAVDRCRTLLHRIGLSLRDWPEEQYLIDLRGGGTTELLGFVVSLVNGSLKYDISPTALDHPSQDSLRSKLIDAHTTPNPPLTSRSLVTGWITAMGPAVDSVRVPELTERVLRVAHSTGNRELSTQYIRDTWTEAGKKWRHFLSLRRPG